MKKIMIFVLALGLLAASPALAQLPKHAPPPNMQEVPNNGRGRVLVGHTNGTDSATAVLSAIRRNSREYFDGPIVLTRAFADQQDQNVQAAFTAKLKGVDVRGILGINGGEEGFKVSLLFDNAKTFAKTYAAMRTDTGKSNGGGGKVAPVKLIRQTAPDGSAQISLPPGYKIVDSYKGTLDITGPGHAIMGLGGPAVVTSYQMANNFPTMAAVDFNDPVRAFLDTVQFNSRKSGVATTVKILDTKPIPWQKGHAAFIRYTATAPGLSIEGFGLYAIMPTAPGQALFYQSSLRAPTATFRQQFPGMLEAWGTYSINQSVFRERLMAAAKSMRETSDMIIATNTDPARRKLYDQVNLGWDQYIRDEGTWMNPTTGKHYTIPTSQTANGAPTQNGVPLQPVPLNQLQP